MRLLLGRCWFFWFFRISLHPVFLHRGFSLFGLFVDFYRRLLLFFYNRRDEKVINLFRRKNSCFLLALSNRAFGFAHTSALYNIFTAICVRLWRFTQITKFGRRLLVFWRKSFQGGYNLKIQFNGLYRLTLQYFKGSFCRSGIGKLLIFSASGGNYSLTNNNRSLIKGFMRERLLLVSE